jgi:hypothetical protein
MYTELLSAQILRFDMDVKPLSPSCQICGHVVPLEECKIDEHGLAVHEHCYVAQIATPQITHILPVDLVVKVSQRGPEGP